ncbi:MAG: hypothetical protein R3B40_07440 [Polyangiales bacterium]
MSRGTTTGAEPPMLARALITLGAPLVVWLVRHAPLDSLEAHGTATVGDLTVGLAPVATGFLLVEVFAALLPSARALRSSGPDGRARLTRWAMVASAGALAFQLLGVALFWNRLGELTLGSALTLVAINVPFTLGLAWLARVVSRQGLANGYAVLFAAHALPVELVLDHPYGRLAGLGVCVGSMAVVAATLRSPKATQRRGELVLRAPLCGLLPITLTGGLLLLPYSLGSSLEQLLPLDALEHFLPGRPQHVLVLAVSVVLLSVACSWAFHRPDTVAPLFPGMDAFTVREAVREALPYTVMALSALTVGATLVERSMGAPLLGYLPGLAYLTALLLDVRDERLARERLGRLVPVWDEHRAYALGPLQKALEDAQIPVHARAAYYRPLVQLAGPLVPLTLMVPPAHATAALEVLTARNAAFQEQLAGHAPSTF